MSWGYAIAHDSDELGNPDRLVVVGGVMEALALPLNETVPDSLYEVRWFSSDGTVVVRGSIANVFVG
jgi:hypothetical protein